MDTKENEWQKGIKQVDTPWVHLSDLKGMPKKLQKNTELMVFRMHFYPIKTNKIIPIITKNFGS